MGSGRMIVSVRASGVLGVTLVMPFFRVWLSLLPSQLIEETVLSQFIFPAPLPEMSWLLPSFIKLGGLRVGSSMRSGMGKQRGLGPSPHPALMEVREECEPLRMM